MAGQGAKIKITLRIESEDGALEVPVEVPTKKQATDMVKAAGKLSNWEKAIACAVKCKPKKGFLACMARCMVDGKACDTGQTNCETAW